MEPITTAALVITGFKWLAGTGVALFLGHKASKAYNKHSKRQKEKLSLKGKSLEEARKDNERAREEEKKTRDDLEEQRRKNEELEKELEEAKRKANDSSLSNEEREKWRRRVIFLEEQLNDGHNNERNLIDRLKKIGERIKDNTKIISGIGSNTDDRHWVWDLVTLENVIIIATIYVVYKMLNKEDGK